MGLLLRVWFSFRVWLCVGEGEGRVKELSVSVRVGLGFVLGVGGEYGYC